jgi:hypothetical protein
MQGFITDVHLAQADEVFPGIRRFFASLANKPRTFLELVSEFEHWTAGPARAMSHRPHAVRHGC